MVRSLFRWGMAAAVVLSARPAAAVSEGDVLPPIVLKPYQAGGALTNAALVGKVTVLNFWATWCAACKVELLEMERQFKPLLAEAGLTLAFVSLDKEPAKAAEWLQGNLQAPGDFLQRLFLDSRFEAADQLKVDAFPMTVVVGKDGKVAHVQRGFKEGEASTEGLVALAGKLLKGG